MKKCPHCGREIPEDSRFCQWCQANLTAPPSTAAPLNPQTSGKAIASLILGILPLIPVTSILAIVFGHISRGEIRRSAGRLKGAGIALAGLIIGYIGLVALPLILIIAAIAIPNLIRARTAANQAGAVSSLRAINVSEITYSSTYTTGFSPDLLSLDGDVTPPRADAAGLIDSVLAAGYKSGYRYEYTAGAPDQKGAISSYTVHADPLVSGATGQYHYFTDQTGVIRREKEKPADENSPPVGG